MFTATGLLRSATANYEDLSSEVYIITATNNNESACYLELSALFFIILIFCLSEMFRAPDGYWDLPGSNTLKFLDPSLRSNWNSAFLVNENATDEICSYVFLWMLCESIFTPSCWACNLFMWDQNSHSCRYAILSSQLSDPKDLDEYLHRILFMTDFDSLKKDFYKRVPIARFRHAALFSGRKWSVRSNFDLLKKFLPEVHKCYLDSIDEYETAMLFILERLQESPLGNDFYSTILS